MCFAVLLDRAADFFLEHTQHHAEFDVDFHLMRLDGEFAAGPTAVKINVIRSPHTGQPQLAVQFFCELV